MLEVKKLNKHFGGVYAVQDCSFTIDQGMITGLIGPNGAGKTTVFNVMTGFYKADSGEVFFDGHDITNMRPDRIANLGIGTTFQLTRLFGNMTVLENVMLAEKGQHEGVWHGLIPTKQAQHQQQLNKEKALQLLDLVSMKEFAHKKAMNLSYGQSKLVEIARILAADATLLLLDEPMAGLNPKMVKLMYGVLKELRSQGQTIVLIEHDMKTIHALCDKVVVLDQGSVISVGSPSAIKKDKKVIDAYIGGLK
jgi:ABC-type branched-subunit amino acid transport system ATPase component